MEWGKRQASEPTKVKKSLMPQTGEQNWPSGRVAFWGPTQEVSSSFPIANISECTFCSLSYYLFTPHWYSHPNKDLDSFGSSRKPLSCSESKYLAPLLFAKSLQSCPTLCDPIDGLPPGSPVPGILQARILEWVAISFPSAWNCRVGLLATSWTAADQAPPSVGFSRQEYWSGVPMASLGKANFRSTE